jgi:plasmid stability protein
MERLVGQSTDPVQRARLGVRLADLRMTLDDPDGAIAALAATAPPADAATGRAMMEARQLLYAHAESERGNKDAALAMLSTLQTAKADAARADIYTARKDWPQTVAALTAWEHKAILTAELTGEQQAMVMRLAVAATLSEDTATLERVAGTYGAAMAKGRSAGFFRVLTAAPVRDKADLPRAFQEIQLTRALAGNPDGLENP